MKKKLSLVKATKYAITPSGSAHVYVPKEACALAGLDTGGTVYVYYDSGTHGILLSSKEVQR